MRGNRARATAGRGPAAAAGFDQQRARRAARGSAPLDQLRRETTVTRLHRAARTTLPPAPRRPLSLNQPPRTLQKRPQMRQHCLCHQSPTAPACRAGPRPSDTRPRPPPPALGQAHTRRPNPQTGRRRRPLYHHNPGRGAPRTRRGPARRVAVARRGPNGLKITKETTHGLV